MFLHIPPMGPKFTTAQYVARITAVHGSVYDYSSVRYLRSNGPIQVRCRVHGIFTQRADVHLAGAGCRPCNHKEGVEKLRLTEKDIISRIRADTPGFIKRTEEGIVLRCLTHGRVVAKLRDRYTSCYMCPECAAARRLQVSKKTTADFIADARQVHGKKYRYKKTDYVRNSSNVTITCPTHGDFLQTPNAHLSGRGCAQCSTHGYSRIAVKWVKQEARARGLKGVQHALSGGEFRLPGTRYKVDGYHAATKTVFEFHGDAFHGNPEVYAPYSKPNPFSTKFACRLHRETKLREERIRSLGYTLVTIWERDFKLRKNRER